MKWTVTNTLLSIASGVAAILEWPWMPLLLVLAVAGWLGQSFYETRKIRRRIEGSVSTMPSVAEINAAIERIRVFMADDSGTIPLPANGVNVNCEACHVSEHYRTNSGAIMSTHLNTHPQWCKVVPA